MTGSPPAGLLGTTDPRAAARLQGLAAADRSAVPAGAGLALVAGPTAPSVRTVGSISTWLVGSLDEGDLGSPEAIRRFTDPEPHAPAGRYLLVVHDADRGVTRVIRDPIGSRPLHYARTGGGWTFAEHLVDLLGVLESTVAPDRTQVVRWLATRSLSAEATLYAGVARLAAGDSLEITRAGARTLASWRPRYRPPVRQDITTVGERVTAAALGAVARASTGARAPGVRLSGGLDSACVAAGLAASDDDGVRDRHALALTFPDHPAIDESALIEETARVTGLTLVRIPYAEMSLVAPLDGYPDRWALPAPSPNLAIHPPLFAAARRVGIDRLLDGEGGDETFGAWPTYVADQLWRGHLWDAWRLVAARPRAGRLPSRPRRLASLIGAGVGGGLPPAAIAGLRRAAALRDATVDRLVPGRDLMRLSEALSDEPWARLDGPRWWRSAVGTLLGVRDVLDASGTLARLALDGGVESRHPFLHDAPLIETVLELDPHAGFTGLRNRVPLRLGLSGQIPDSVRNRYAKSFFNELSARRLEGDDGAELRRRLAAPDAPIREYVRAAGLAAALRPPSTDTRYATTGLLFRLAAVDGWLRAMAGR